MGFTDARMLTDGGSHWIKSPRHRYKRTLLVVCCHGTDLSSQHDTWGWDEQSVNILKVCKRTASKMNSNYIIIILIGKCDGRSFGTKEFFYVLLKTWNCHELSKLSEGRSREVQILMIPLPWLEDICRWHGFSSLLELW